MACEFTQVSETCAQIEPRERVFRVTLERLLGSQGRSLPHEDRIRQILTKYCAYSLLVLSTVNDDERMVKLSPQLF